MTIQPQRIAGLAALASAFDCYLIDQYGVLHDGRAPYPGTVEALRKLAEAGKRSIILTNSGKRSAVNAERLVRLGFPAETFSHVVSSGEVTWQAIADGSLGPPLARGARVFVVGRQDDDYGLTGLALEPVARPEHADFVLISGSDAPATSLQDYGALLRLAAAKRVPALCANPDMLMLTDNGLQPAPGGIADVYAKLGGPVTYTGKPYPAIYRFALRLADGVEQERVLAVGDSAEHDVAGATAMGLSSALVRTGILAAEPEDALASVFARFKAYPTYILEAFRW